MKRSDKFFTFLLGIVLLNVYECAPKVPKNICQGTDFRGWERFEIMDRSFECVNYYQTHFEGCTHIVGNFELFSTEQDRHVHFLQHIEEISGYLLIYKVVYSNLNFPNLRIIRGESLFQSNPTDPGYALVVLQSNVGELTFPALREISNGSVGIFSSKSICSVENMNWTDILEEEGAKLHYFSRFNNISNTYTLPVTNDSDDKCYRCSSSCRGGCWGSMSSQCQKLSKTGCSGQCQEQGGRCFGAAPSECCHSLCSAGCSGPSAKDCFSCKYVYENGECRDGCSGGRLSYGVSCVETCPRKALLDEENGACLVKCPDDKIEENGYCRRLLPSEKKCRNYSYRWREIHSGNVDYYRGCTFLDGDIFINEHTFSGNLNYYFNATFRSRQRAMNFSRLEALSAIKIITGTLQVSGNFSSFGLKNLPFFANLEQIGRQKLPCKPSEKLRLVDSLNVLDTDLEIVDFRNLRMVKGDISFNRNKNLCYVNTLNLTSIVGNYGRYYKNSNARQEWCIKEGRFCSSGCTHSQCWGPKSEDCFCLRYRQEAKCVNNCNVAEGYLANGESCLKSCPVGKFNATGVCHRCHGNCEGGCTGHFKNLGGMGCNFCRYSKLRYNNGTAICMGKKSTECPIGFYSGKEKNECLQQQETPMNESINQPEHTTIAKNLKMTFWIVTALFSISVLIIGLIVGIKMQFFKKDPEVAQNEQADTIPLVCPNLIKFRIIEEKDLRRDLEMGSGAFGKVFRGIWMPAEKNTLKIPVAIKVLRGAAGAKESASLVDEAYLMAGVQHPNLLQLLALCLSSSEIMLVTQLMPLGCLQKYLRVNRDKISAGTMLSWIMQIAKGMEYLESRRIVHRDLAARNVLVETPSTVKITDFGLAKLLGLSQQKCEADGKKLPIKWLALECFKEHTFSHKSDVWAFGVTVWEILTCGENPYKDIPIENIFPMLEGGGRLEQPDNCTIEMRMVLVKTSMPDPESRPSFSELVTSLEEMCQNPPRYIVIPDDGKLLQLPEYTHEDELQLLYSLASKFDLPEELVTPQEYAALLEVSPAVDYSGYLIPENQANLEESGAVLVGSNNDYYNDSCEEVEVCEKL